MKEQVFRAMVTSYLTGELSDEGKAQVLDACRQSAERQKFFEDAEKIWDMVGDEPPVDVPNIEKEWQVFSDLNFDNSESREQTTKVVGRRFLFLRLAAAIAFLVASVGVWYFVSTDGVATERLMVFAEEDVKEVSLPDGSLVWLHPGSNMAYDLPFEDRILELEGKALFEVRHTSSDDRFVVKAGDSEVTVLGTTFMVDASDNSASVGVFVEEGTVMLSAASQQEVLTGGQQATYAESDQKISIADTVDDNILSWKTGRFIFSHSPLALVIPQLETYYKVRIEVNDKGILDCTWRADFENLLIDQVLQDLVFSLGMELEETDDGTYLLSGSRCK